MTDKIEELTKQIEELKEAVAFLLTRVDGAPITAYLESDTRWEKYSEFYRRYRDPPKYRQKKRVGESDDGN